MREQGQDKAAPVIAPTPRAATSSGLEGLSYAQLKARLNELQQQRQTIASRREAIAGQYERASGANQRGIGDRLTVMDNSIEIERVSENQRFMTRLMTETQLAGTIAAVRNSAEAAKDQVAG